MLDYCSKLASESSPIHPKLFLNRVMTFLGSKESIEDLKENLMEATARPQGTGYESVTLL